MSTDLYPTNFSKEKYKQIAEQLPTQENLPPSVARNTIQNPFALESYGNTGLSDTPLQMGGGITEALLGDTNVPEKIKNNFWQIFIKDNVLTFLDAERKQDLMLNFDITKIDELNAIPYFDYDFKAELNWNILRNVYQTKLDRSMGFKGGNVKNERILLQSQFTEQRQISEMNTGPGAKEGFFKRLMGRR